MNKGILGALILLLFFNVSISRAQSQDSKISLSVQNVELKEFLNVVEEKSSFSFIYRDAIVDHKNKVTLTASNETIQQILNRVLPARGLQYTINGTSIQIDVLSVASAKKQVKGVIRSEDGELLPGVAVKEVGTHNGVISDLDGGFSLSVAEDSRLEISYLGFASQTVSVKGKDLFNISMREDLKMLDEVVVVGYGVQKKVNLTGSVASIKGSDIASKPVISLNDALAGMATGMTVTKSSGQPGSSAPTIRVRGVGTWENASPLILVDGMAMSIGDVMPGDIESISVLKDAASAAIYGSRGANGVILITTKQGKAGKVKITYNGTVGLQQATRTPKMAKSWQYAELYNQAQRNDGQTTQSFSLEAIERMKAGGNPDHDEGSTDWFKELLSIAPQYSQDVSIAGGTDKISYVGSLGWARQEGVIQSSYERYNTRLNTTAQVTNWFKLTSNIAYINDVSRETAGGPSAAYYKAPRAMPYNPVKYSDGTWSYKGTPTNPVRMTKESDYGYQRWEMDKLTVLVSPEVSLFEKSLILKGVLGYEARTAYIDKFQKRVEYGAFHAPDAPGGTGTDGGVAIAQNQKTDTWQRNRNMTLTGTATYMKSFGKHDVNILVGGSREQFRYNSTSASRKDFPYDEFEVIEPGDAATSSASGNKTYDALISGFGRVTYAFDNRYLFEANVRHDGSSKFKKGEQWGTFPSFSFAWRLSEEKFFAPATDYIQNLKFRASWGKLGNQRIPNYSSMSTYTKGANTLFGDGNIHAGYTEGVMGNPFITWESSDNLDFGVDFTILRNRLEATFDWYSRTTNDILLALQAPALLGLKPYISNAGTVDNKGWELSLNWQDQISNDFSYKVGFTLADVKNKIIDMKGSQPTSEYLTINKEGYPIQSLYGWETLGIADTQEKYEKYKDVMQAFNPNWGLGDIIIKDLQEEGEVGYGKIDANDKKVIGNQIPRYTYTIDLGFNYKNIDFMAMFQGVGKVDGFLGRDVIEPLGVMSAYENHYTDSFDPANPSEGKWFPRMSLKSRHNYQNMSHWVQDASYLRLKTVQLGYTFIMPKSSAVERIRLSVSGQNVLTFTKFKILDPETGANSMSFPNVAVYSFGVNVVF